VLFCYKPPPPRIFFLHMPASPLIAPMVIKSNLYNGHVMYHVYLDFSSDDIKEEIEKRLETF